MSIPAWLHVVRAFECAAVACISIPLVILPMYMYIALGMKYKCMMGWMSLLTILSSKYNPAGTTSKQRRIDVDAMSWHDVTSTSIRCCFKVVCMHSHIIPTFNRSFVSVLLHVSTSLPLQLHRQNRVFVIRCLGRLMH